MRNPLSARRAAVLSYIKEEVSRRGYPPSVREIAKAVGLQSSSSVHAHLQKLEEDGYIRRDPAKPRAIEILPDEGDIMPREARQVPVVGQVTAGAPILAVENIEEYFPIPKGFTEFEDLFMLRIKGDSMIEAGIFDRDHVLVEKRQTVKNGDIVVALLNEEEATVKRYFHEGTHVRLQPENSTMDPIITEDVSILGKVVGVFRRIY